MQEFNNLEMERLLPSLSRTMETLRQDIRFAIRGFKNTPGFSIAAILTLALAIAGNTTIFSLVSAILLRPLPFKDPDGLVLIRERIPKLIPQPIPAAPGDAYDYQTLNRTLDQTAIYETGEVDVTGIGDPQRIDITKSSSELVPLLGVQPQIGRYFTADEDKRHAKVAVLSYAGWQKWFAGSRDVLNKTIRIDREPYSIIGVMPSSFLFPIEGTMSTPDSLIFVPLGFAGQKLVHADNFSVSVLGRLRPGITPAQATADVEAICKRTIGAIVSQFEMHAVAVPLKSEIASPQVRTLLWLLLGAVGFVLLIGCANVANLLLSRAAGRQRETAIRIALGAGKIRLVRQMLTESCVLGIAGCIVGLLAAAWGVPLLVHVVGSKIPLAYRAELDWRVLAFSIGLSLVTGLLFGLSPALAAWRGDPNDALKDGSKGSAGRGRHRLQSTFVIAEIALTMVLLAGSGLLVRSLLKLQSSNLGFRPESLLTLKVSASKTTYATDASERQLFETVLSRIASTPGVRIAGAGSNRPLSPDSWTRVVSPEGYKLDQSRPPLDRHTVVLGNYFQAFGITLKAGRYFTDDDRNADRHTVIISDAFARQFWPGQNALGKRVKFGPPNSNVPWNTVVGIVSDTVDDKIDKAPLPHTYVAYARDKFEGMPSPSMVFAVRASGDPLGLASAIRTQVWSVDREAPVTEMESMITTISDSQASRRLNTWVIGLFAAGALLLAAIGLYGVIAYSVTQRTQELGIRVALGASGISIASMVVGKGIRLGIIGVAIGSAGALALGKFFSEFLYGVSANDPITLAAVAVFLTAITALASYVPARRAAKVDPIRALRYE